MTANYKDLYMSQERYYLALKRIRALIADGIPLIFEDSTTIGDKYTHCSWGLCSEDPRAWPDAEDHLWPDQFLADKRVALKYLRDDQMCPMDRRVSEGSRGCFYTCRIFQPKKCEPRIETQEEALHLYDERIALIEKE